MIWAEKKKLDVDSKAIQQIKLVGQLKRLDAHYNVTDSCND